MKKSNIQKNFERKAASLRSPSGLSMPSNLSTPRFASGGSIGKALRIGSQDAGEISGPGGPTDDKVPAMISNKEYVLSEKMKEAIGLENLEGLRARIHGHEAIENDMRNAQGLAEGGSVTGGTVVNRANMIEQVTSQPVAPAPVAPAPAPATPPQSVAPAAPTGNFDPAFLAKNGLGADGRPLPKPGLMDRARKMIGLAEGGAPGQIAPSSIYINTGNNGTAEQNVSMEPQQFAPNAVTRTITGTGNSGLRTSDSVNGKVLNSGSISGISYTPDARPAPAAAPTAPMSSSIPPPIMAAPRVSAPPPPVAAPQPVQPPRPPADMSGSVMNPAMAAAFGRPGPTGRAFASGQAPYVPGPVAPTNIPEPMRKSMRDSYSNAMLSPAKPISLHFPTGGATDGTSLIARPNWIFGQNGEVLEQAPRAAAPGYTPTQAPPIEATPAGWRGRLAQAAPTVEKMIPQGGTVAKTGMRAMGAAGNAIVPAIETSRVYDVAASDKTSGMDVANQVATGVGRGAATAAGAGIGSAVLPGVGTIIGGLAGYYGGDKLIKGLRSAVGTDPRDPSEQLAPPPSTPVQARPQAQAVAAPAGAGNRYANMSDEEILNSPPPYMPTPEWRAARDAAMNRSFSKTAAQAIAAGAQEKENQPQQYQSMRTPPVDPRSLPVDPMNDRAARRAMYAQQDAAAAQTSNPMPFTRDDMEAPGLRGAINRAYARNQAKFDAELNERRRSAMAGDTTARRGQSLSYEASRAATDTSRYGHELNYDASVQGHQMSAATARWQGKIAQMNKDREYQFDREKFGEQQANTRFEQRQKAQKDITEQISAMIPPVVGPDGKAAPNTAAAAQHMTALNTVVGTVLAKRKLHQQLHPNDAENNAAVKSLEERGIAGLGADEIRRFVVGNELARNAQQEHSVWNPLKPTAVAGDQPITSLKRKPGIIFDDYVSDRGDVIPAHMVDRTGSILGIGGQRNIDNEILKKKN